MDATANHREQYLALLEEHASALRRLCHAYCDRASDAEDLFQEISLALWSALARFRGDCSTRTWSYRIAHNVAITFVARRRKQLHREQTDDAGMEAAVDAALGAESALAHEQQRALLHRHIRELSFADRQLVLLHLEGLATADIEAVTGLTRSNVTVRLSRLRQNLADRMRDAKIGRATQ